MSGEADSFLARLRELNVDRCETRWHPIDDLNALEWAGAMAGEAGETANKAKKLVGHTRGWYDTIPQFDNPPGGRVTALDVGIEVADTLIYADLLCASLGLSLEEVVRKAFNDKSQEIGYERML